MSTGFHARVYEWASRGFLLLLTIPGLGTFLSWFAKVWLRQSRIVAGLRRGGFDAVVDGGASIGEFAALARLACPNAMLVCVEPHPPSAATLRRRGFRVVEAALWRETGTLTLRQPTEAITSCTVAGSGGTGPGWTVRSARLDELGLEGANILIKLDLQGAELEALEGMGGLWERCGGLLLEVSYGPQGTYERLRALLAERGFFEAATFNELEDPTGVIEADKLWLRRRATPPQAGVAGGNS